MEERNIITAKFKADNAESITALLVAFHRESKERCINICNGIGTIKIDANELTENLITACGECGVIEWYYNGFSEMKSINNNSNDTEEVSTELEMVEETSRGSEETNLTDVEICKEVEEATIITEKIPFDVKVCTPIKNIIDSAESDLEVAEKIADFFNLGVKTEWFKQILVVSLRITADVTWEELEKNIGKTFIQYDKSYTGTKVKRLLESLGYEVKSLLKVIRKIKEYFNSIHKVEAVQSIPETDSTTCVNEKEEVLPVSKETAEEFIPNEEVKETEPENKVEEPALEEATELETIKEESILNSKIEETIETVSEKVMEQASTENMTLQCMPWIGVNSEINKEEKIKSIFSMIDEENRLDLEEDISTIISFINGTFEINKHTVRRLTPELRIKISTIVADNLEKHGKEPDIPSWKLLYDIKAII